MSFQFKQPPRIIPQKNKIKTNAEEENIEDGLLKSIIVCPKCGEPVLNMPHKCGELKKLLNEYVGLSRSVSQVTAFQFKEKANDLREFITKYSVPVSSNEPIKIKKNEIKSFENDLSQKSSDNKTREAMRANILSETVRKIEVLKKK